jgi:uroporphyrinogen-III synthase
VKPASGVRLAAIGMEAARRVQTSGLQSEATGGSDRGAAALVRSRVCRTEQPSHGAGVRAATAAD